MNNTLFYLAKRKKNESGAAAVEFALVFPLLVFFLFGIITYGYILSLQQAVTQSAAEGARSAAISVATLTPFQKNQKAYGAIEEILGAYGLECNENGLTCSVTTAPCSGDAASSCVKVTVAYNWEEEPRIPKFPGLPTPKLIDHSTTVEVS